MGTQDVRFDLANLVGSIELICQNCPRCRQICPADWNRRIVNQPGNGSSGRSFQRANTVFGHPPAAVHTKAQPGIDDGRRVRQPHQDQCRAVEGVHTYVMILGFECEYVPAQSSRKLRHKLVRVSGSGGRLFPGCGHSHPVVRKYEADDQQLNQRHEREQSEQLNGAERSALLKHPESPRHEERHGHCGCGRHCYDPRCRSSARRSGRKNSLRGGSGSKADERNDYPERISHGWAESVLRSEWAHHPKQRAESDCS